MSLLLAAYPDSPEGATMRIGGRLMPALLEKGNTIVCLVHGKDCQDIKISKTGKGHVILNIKVSYT